MGITSGMKFEFQQVRIQPGDMLLGFTDGVTEALSPHGEFFTSKQLLSVLEQPADSGSDLIKRIETNVFNHIRNGAPSDDITMLTVHRLH